MYEVIILGCYQGLDSEIRWVLGQQFETTFTSQGVVGGSYTIGGPSSTESQDFLNEITTLLPGFSKLQALKSAAKVALFPPGSYHHTFSAAPRFVMRPGDIGSAAGLQNDSWEGLRIGSHFNVTVSI